MAGSPALRLRRLLITALPITILTGCNAAPPPTSPGVLAGIELAAGPNGETLKVAAPVLQAPIAGVQLQSPVVFLTFAGVVGKYSPFVPTYQIELRDAGGAVVASPTLAPTTYLVTATLTRDAVYTWRARAVFEGAFGPWSASASFRTSRP